MGFSMQSAYASRWVGLCFIALALLVTGLDNTVLNVALPAIADQFDASISQLQWVITAYVLVFASLLLAMGSLADRIGRRRTLHIGLVLFALGSAVAATARSIEMLIAVRAFLGFAGALLTPATLSLTAATFRDPTERARAIAVCTAIFAFGVGIGPLVGGWLLEHFNWQAVFLINMPVTLIALVGTALTVRDSRDPHAQRPDMPGVALSALGLFALVYGIIEAGTQGWTAPPVLAAFAVAGAVLLLFARWEAHTAHGIVPPGLFRNPTFTGASLALALLAFALFGALFFLSQYLQSVQGYGALDAGLRLLPMALVAVGGSALAPVLAGFFGTKRTVGTGILVASLGLLFLAQVATVTTPYPVLLLGLCIIAAGVGLAGPPATSAILGAMPVRQAGVGSALNDTTRQIGGALGVAVLGTVMNGTYLVQLSHLPFLTGSALPDMVINAIRAGVQGAHIAAARLNLPVISDAIVRVANEAFVAGMIAALQFGGLVTLAAALFTFVVLPHRDRAWGEDAKTLEEPMPRGIGAD